MFVIIMYKMNGTLKQQRSVAGVVRQGVKNGWLKRPKYCESCKKKDYQIHAHHTDYSRPLFIKWLCPKCHMQEHARIKRPTNKYVKFYGASAIELADILNCNEGTVRRYHKTGVLKTVLHTGKKPKSKCIYRSKYGFAAKEIAAKLNISIPTVAYNHKNGRLKDYLLAGQKPKSNCMYRRIYGLSLVEIAEKLSISTNTTSILHHSGRLKEILRLS